MSRTMVVPQPAFAFFTSGGMSQMSRTMVGLLGISLLLALTAAGCGRPGEVAEPYAMSMEEESAQSSVPQYYASHNDQGMLADMSITDTDFVPYSSKLSGAGVARLGRYAELLAASGGKLNYDASTTDDELISSRIETAKCFLADATPDNQEIMVVQGLAGGRGMNGKDALAAREVAAQPEPRKTAYKLSDTTGTRESGD